MLIVCGWPLAKMVHSRPEDVGQRIDGLPRDAEPPNAGSTAMDAANSAVLVVPVQNEYTAREALRTSAFWLLSLGHACSLFVVSAINVHAITHIKEGLGYSLALASLYITIVTAGQFVGVVCGWVIPEKFEKRKVTALTMLFHATGMILGLSSMIMVIGQIGGPLIAGAFADWLGNYRVGFTIIAALAALGSLFFWMAKRPA